MRMISRMTVRETWSVPDEGSYFVVVACDISGHGVGVCRANRSVEADATPAGGHEDEILGKDGCALWLVRHLAEGLPCANDASLEVLLARKVRLLHLHLRNRGDEVTGSHEESEGWKVGLYVN